MGKSGFLFWFTSGLIEGYDWVTSGLQVDYNLVTSGF